MSMFDEIFIGKTFNIKYDKFNLEIRVVKMQKEHNVKCSFLSKGNHKEAYGSIFRFFNELVWFYDMQSDGYSLDDKRTKTPDKNDIPDIVAKWNARDKKKGPKKGEKCAICGKAAKQIAYTARSY